MRFVVDHLVDIVATLQAILIPVNFMKTRGPFSFQDECVLKGIWRLEGDTIEIMFYRVVLEEFKDF